MRFNKTKRFVKKTAKRAGKFLRKRYSGWNGIRNGVNDVASVAKLASMINAEKRRTTQIIQSSSTNSFGQFRQTSGTTATSGHWVYDLTPIVTQGTSINQRSGSSIKMTSSYMKLQLGHMINTAGNLYYKGYIVQVLGAPQNINTMVTQFLQATLFVTGVTSYDYNSLIRPDYLGQYKIIKQFSGLLQADNIAGQQRQVERTIKLRWNKGKGHHIRYDADSNVITDGQIIMILLADTGNCGTVDNTGTPVIAGQYTNQNSSGATINMANIHYYYDN